MKKALIIMTSLMLLAGCSQTENAPEQSTTKYTDIETRQVQTAEDTETVTETDMSYAETEEEEVELPFHNEAKYKVYKKTTYSDNSSYIDIKTYDEHDNVILRESYDGEGEFSHIKESAYEYDGDGNVVKQYESIDDYYVSEYENGRKIRYIHYYKGEISFELTHEYYPNGDYKCGWFSYDGDEPFMWSYYEYEYDENGRHSICRELTDEGVPMNTDYYTYDESGNVAEKVIIKNSDYYVDLDESRAVRRYKWTYDDNGNQLTSVITYESLDGVVSMEDVTEFKYDEQDRLVSETLYHNGEFDMVTEYTYEDIN